MTAIGSNFSACASACCSQKPKWPVQNRMPLPCASASRTRSSPSHSTSASCASCGSDAYFSSSSSSRPKCWNIAFAMARHCFSDRLRKCDLQIGERDAAMDAIDQVEQQAEAPRRARAHRRERKRPHGHGHRPDGEVLEPLSHATLPEARAVRSRSASQGRERRLDGRSSSGTIRSDVLAPVPQPDESLFLSSGSPARQMPRPRPSIVVDLAIRVSMMIARTTRRPVSLPAGLFEIGEETLGPRDAGKRKRGPVGGRTGDASGKFERDRHLQIAPPGAASSVLCGRAQALLRPQPVSTSNGIRRAGRIERLAKPAERQRARVVQRRRAPRADRRRASDRNAETRRPARAPCSRASIRRHGRRHSGSTTRGRPRPAPAAPASAARLPSARHRQAPPSHR